MAVGLSMPEISTALGKNKHPCDNLLLTVIPKWAIFKAVVRSSSPGTRIDIQARYE